VYINDRTNYTPGPTMTKSDKGENKGSYGWGEADPCKKKGQKKAHCRENAPEKTSSPTFVSLTTPKKEKKKNPNTKPTKPKKKHTKKHQERTGGA